MRRTRTIAGTTLLEILVAMLVIGLVATGIVTSFIFSRRVTWRSGTELSSSSLVTEVAEGLRGAIGGDLPNGLSLAPGVYVDEHMGTGGGNVPAGAIAIAGLNLPADFQRFLTNTGSAGATVAAANHADGRMVIVENAGEDRDGDGQGGISFDGGVTTALRRVRIRIKWTSPNA